MQTVKLTRYNNKIAYYVRRQDNEELTQYLAEITSINERKEPFYSNIKTHKTYDITRKDLTLRHDNHYVYIPITFIKYLDTRVKEIGFSFDYSSIDLSPILRKPEGQLRHELENFYTKDFSDKLLTVIDEMCTQRNGLINLPCGFGKSWLIVGLLRIYLKQNKSGNMLVLADGSAVVAELISRSEYMKIDTEFKGRYQIVNTASIDAKRFRTPEMLEWLKNCDVILIDECETITPTLKVFLESLDQYKSIYGFSATPDIYHGRALNELDNFNKFDDHAYKLLYYVGFSFIYRKSDKEIDVNIVYSHFSGKKYSWNEKRHYQEAIDRVVYHPNFIKVLKYVVDHATDTVYMPVSSTIRINKIIEMIKQYDPSISYVFWAANNIWDSYGNDYNNDYLKLAQFYAEKPWSERPRLVMSTRTSYKGICIPQLTDILLVENCQFNNVGQTLGRTFRYESPTAWLVQESDSKTNIVFRLSTFKRLKVLKTQFNVVNTKYITPEV